MHNSTTYRQEKAEHGRRAGFTLIEVMVALAITMILLAVILVPINLAINMMHIGRAKSEVQQASLLALNQMERELQRAIYVYPNDVLPGVTDRAPFNRSDMPVSIDPAIPSGNPTGKPYFQLTSPLTATDTSAALSGSQGACDVNNSGIAVPAVNRSRIDFLLPRTSGGSLVTPVAPEYYLVSYYARRLYMNTIYDPITNPVVMFRAQVPYRLTAGGDYTVTTPVGAPNASTSSTRYPKAAECTATRTQLNRGSAWLTQDGYGEPNLEPLCTDTTEATPVVSSHTLVTPRGMVLVASKASVTATDSLIPDTSFLCDDVNSDGKIDRVKITLVLGQYDVANAAPTRNNQPTAQVARTTLTVAMPNIK